LLLDAGADPKAVDTGGRTPMTVEHGLRGAEVKALLREAVRNQSGRKEEKGQGLSFVRGKGKGVTAWAGGAQDFRRFYYDSQPEWAVALVRAPIEAVASAYVDLVKPVRWDKDVAKRKTSSAKKLVYLLQLKDSAWTVIFQTLGFLSEADVRAVETAARELSERLKTRAYTYLAEDTSGAEEYELFEHGQSLEKATNCEKLEFSSKLRPRPDFNPELFPDPVFTDEGICLPACYPKDDGYDIKLVVEGFQRGDVARADFVALEE